MNLQFFLDQSTKLRISVFTFFYMAQGIPIALLTIALPAWLIAQDFAAAEVAALVSITGLPWGFKLLAGPFMDRFSFAPMGFRRPWAMGAQGGLVLAMASLCLVTDPAGQYWHLVCIGFIINCFAALQDVAVDGMAIDLLPSNERGRANAFMAFGQVAGYSVFGALNGWLLVAYGIPGTALVSSIAILIVFILVALVRERPGERLLPWTHGIAAPRSIKPAASFGAILRDLMTVIFLPMSLVLTGAEFLSRMGAGITLTIFPLVAVQDLGFSSEQYAFAISTASALSAVVGILFGPLIDRYGVKYLLITGLLITILTTVMFALAEPFWREATFISGALFLSQLAAQMAFVAAIAGFMTICWTKVAATQFSIYMSLANLARSVGAGLYALIAIHLTNLEALYIVAGLNLLAVLLLLSLNLEEHKKHINRLNAPTSNS